MTTEIAPVPEPPPVKRSPTTRVIGVGRAGLQAVTHMSQNGFAGLTFAGMHTDARQLAHASFDERVLLGASLTRGLGAGGDPDIGRAAAETELAALRRLCAAQDLVILVAGLGGGTGSGAAPVLARIAREGGALVLALVALPFEFEGARRQGQAQQALRQLKTAADAVISLPNQKVVRLIDEQTTLADALKITNEYLTQGLRGIWRLVAQEGLINVDFADLCQVVRGRHAESCFAAAEAAGDSRSRDVLDQLFSSPLLDQGHVLSEADAVLVSLVGGPDLTIREVNQVMEQVNRSCERAQVVMGAAVDPAFAERLGLTVIAARRSQPDADASGAKSGRSAEPEPPAAEFPANGDGAAPETAGTEAEGRPAPHYVAPPPVLTPAQAEELLARQGKGAGRRLKKTNGMRQGMLPLEVVSKGRFAHGDRTLRRGEDLDTPTYVRRGVALN